jgi:single-strand DNA-binding protein
MNNVQIIGRLVRDNSLRYSPSGVAVLNNTVAVNRRFKKDEADFINILAFKQGAELIANHFNKGDEIAITGHIQTGDYEKDGRKVYTTEVVVDQITFTNGKKNNNQSTNQSSNQNNNQGSNNYTRVDDDPFTNDSVPIDISDSDLPF